MAGILKSKDKSKDKDPTFMMIMMIKHLNIVDSLWILILNPRLFPKEVEINQKYVDTD